METLEPVLAEHPFLQGLTKDHLDLITGCASNVRFEVDNMLFRENDEAKQFYVIRSGKVGIEMHVPGRGVVTIQTLGEGDILGWSWLFPPYRWLFSARAVELTRVIALDGVCLRNKCEIDHNLGYELLKRFSLLLEDRIQAMRIQLLDLYREQ